MAAPQPSSQPSVPSIIESRQQSRPEDDGRRMQLDALEPASNALSAVPTRTPALPPADNSTIISTEQTADPKSSAIAVGPRPVLASEKKRPMVRAKLLGKHRHHTRNGPSVLIYERNGRYLARGYRHKQRFGETLPRGRSAAEARLAEILTDLRSGTYLRPSEARKQPLKHGPISRLTLRQLVDRYIADKRRLRGKKTAADYQARLTAVLEFAEAPTNLRHWPYVQDLDRAFGVELRAFLFSRSVTGNGHPLAQPRRMSGSQIRNILETLTMALNWGKRPDVNLLPVFFVNPISYELVGPRIMRDPLAPPEVPMELRIEMVQRMDRWQLAMMTLPFTLPGRPEDFAGLLIDEVLFDRRELVYGTRFGGADFNKGHMAFRMIFPPEVEPILRWWANLGTNGPLLLGRGVVEQRHKSATVAGGTVDIADRFNQMLAKAKPGDVSAEQDRKRLFRALLRQLGGVSTDAMARTFKLVLEKVRPGASIRFYSLRHSITTELKDAGVDSVFRRYVTAHSLKGEILAYYESQDLQRHLGRYFDHIRPLLSAIAQRAKEVGVG